MLKGSTKTTYKFQLSETTPNRELGVHTAGPQSGSGGRNGKCGEGTTTVDRDSEGHIGEEGVKTGGEPREVDSEGNIVGSQKRKTY